MFLRFATLTHTHTNTRGPVDFEGTIGKQALRATYGAIAGYAPPLGGTTIPGGDLKAFMLLGRDALVSVGLAAWKGHAPAGPNQLAESAFVSGGLLSSIFP